MTNPKLLYLLRPRIVTFFFLCSLFPFLSSLKICSGLRKKIINTFVKIVCKQVYLAHETVSHFLCVYEPYTELKLFASVDKPMENNHGEYMRLVFMRNPYDSFENIDYVFAVYLYRCKTFIVIFKNFSFSNRGLSQLSESLR